MRVELTSVVLLSVGLTMSGPIALRAQEPGEAPCNAGCQRWMGAGREVPAAGEGSPLEIAPAPMILEVAPQRRRVERPSVRPPRVEALRPNPLVARMVRSADGVHLVELAWASPPRPRSAHFFLEVRALVDGSTKELLTRFSPDRSASIEVPGNASRLFWRVSGVYPKLKRYVTADWQAVNVVARK